MDETTKLELGHFAELARMLKYVDRHDEEEIAKYGPITVDKIKIFDEWQESVDRVGWIPFEVWLDDRPIYSAQFNRQDSRKK